MRNVTWNIYNLTHVYVFYFVIQIARLSAKAGTVIELPAELVAGRAPIYFIDARGGT
jgi:hypothetical protein